MPIVIPSPMRRASSDGGSSLGTRAASGTFGNIPTQVSGDVVSIVKLERRFGYNRVAVEICKRWSQGGENVSGAGPGSTSEFSVK